MLGGNGSTLAAVNSLVPRSGSITARLVPLAWTPLGVVLGDTWQNVGITLTGLLDWADRTFSAQDERAFVAPARDVELLARIGWHAPLPASLDHDSVLNIDDLPEEIVEAIAQPPAALVQCAACRRLCVRDDFVWKERTLCAWDYHASVFGRRGPWHTGPYEDRHLHTLPHAAYVASPLLVELGVEIVLILNAVDEAAGHAAIEALLRADPLRSHLAVRTEGGFTLLREAVESA